MPEAEIRRGRQTPTSSRVLEYEQTLGKEAIDLYETTGRKAQEWQKLLVYDIMARNADDLWTHSRFGYAVPRQNGKNEIVSIRELWGLMHGERILHTAHRTTTSRAAWERLKLLLDDAKIDHKDSGALGQERIRLKETGGVISFRTRSKGGGIGESYDLLVVDEAQEYTLSHESALKYVIAASPNPQNIFCGTPPTADSVGTVFADLRDHALMKGDLEDTGWAEWSVEEQHDPHDKEAWYETNPSLGLFLRERTIQQEIGDKLDFNIQRLGFWVRYNLKSAVSQEEWLALKLDKPPELRSRIFAGVKYSKTGSVALSIAVRATDNRIFVEGIDCRPFRDGTDWIVAFLRRIDCKAVAIDGQSGQQLLRDAMKDAHLTGAILPKVADIIKASAVFEERLAAKELCHAGQLSMVSSVTNCEKRPIGSNGGFGYKSINDLYDIAIMDSMVLAQWVCGQKTKKSARKPKYSY